MSGLEIENYITNDNNLEKEQRKFLQTSIGKAINIGVDIGIRALFPDLIENQIINIKDSFFNNGFHEGVKTAVDSAIDFYKSITGIFTGNFSNIQQMQQVVKKGGVIDSVSGLINNTVNKAVERGKISHNIGSVIKNGKNLILNSVTKNIEKEFDNQVNNIEKLNKYTENWKMYYDNRDFDGMEKEYKKIKMKLNETAPIEKMIKEARTIENLHKLIKNKGQDFELSNEEIEVAKVL